MAKPKHNHIKVVIQDQGGEVEHILRPNDALTVGRTPDNDVLVYDHRYPRSQSLIRLKKNECHILLHPAMGGHLRYRDSEISLQSLIIQDILPKEKGMYQLKVEPGHTGTLQVGDKRVHFQYASAPARTLPYDDFSWRSAARKSLLRDGIFKLLLILFPP